MMFKASGSVRVSVMLALAGGLLAGSTSMAQVAPPPPVAPTPTPKWTPPPPKPRQVKLQQNQAQPEEKVPYDSLVEFDDNGKLVELAEPIEVAALRNNPYVGAKTWQLIMPVLGERQREVARAVIDNIDVMIEVEEGLVENLDISDSVQLGRVTEALKPFASLGNINTALQNANVLSRTQVKMNSEIGQEYVKAMSDQVAAQAREALPDIENAGQSAMIRYWFSVLLWEAKDSFHRQLIKSIKTLDGVLSQLEMSDDQRSQVEVLAAAAQEEGLSKDDIFSQMFTLLKALDGTQQRDFLRKTMEIRTEKARRSAEETQDDDK